MKPTTSLCLGTLLAAAPLNAALFSDDFEAAPLASFPPGWSDVGSVPGAEPGAPDPSALVIATTNAFGVETRAVRIVDARHNSQGLVRQIPSLPLIRVSVDLRIDQFAEGSQVAANDWAWDVAILDDTDMDVAIRSSMGVFASAMTGGVRTFSAGLSAPTSVDDFALGGGVLQEGVWYRLRAVFDRQSGRIHAWVSNIREDSVLVSNVRQIPDWAGQAGEPDFTFLGIFDGELGQNITRNNITTIDNVVVFGSEAELILHPPTGTSDLILQLEGVPGARYSLDYADVLPASGEPNWLSRREYNMTVEPVEHVETINVDGARFFRLRQTSP